MTILLKAINTSDTVLMFSGGFDLPQDDGVIQIESEIITYSTIYMSTMYGCTRAIRSTSAASHASGSTILFIDSFTPASGGGSGITQLTSDVTAGPGSGSQASTVVSVGGSSASNVHSAELLANAATNVNSASAIVKRDGSGTFLISDPTATQGAATKNYVDTHTSGTSSPVFNYYYNGNMLVDQRNEGASVTCSGANNNYGPDTWFGYTRNMSGAFTMQRLSTTPPAGFLYYLHIATSTQDTTPPNNAEYVLSTRIEGPDFANTSFGTANAINLTLSFWVRGSVTGTYGCSVEDGRNSGDAYVLQYTINSANTWEYKTFSVVGDTAGVWSTGAGQIGCKLIVDLGSGSDFAGTANTWSSAAEKNHVTGNVQLITANGRTLDITGVVLQPGTIATAVPQKSYGDTLRDCQRFYEKSYQDGTVPGTNTGNGTNSNVLELWARQTGAADDNTAFRFITTKAKTPTMTFYTPGGVSGKMTWFASSGSSADRTVTIETSGTQGVGIFQTDNGTDTFVQGHYVADSSI